MDDVVADFDAARSAELLPLGYYVSFLVDGLDAAVRTVGEVKPAGRIHREAVGDVKLTLARPMMTPAHQEFAVARIFDDAIVGILDREIATAVGDKDVTIGRYHDSDGELKVSWA